MSVHRWKAIVSLLCLATWLPATQHCKLESLPGLEFLHCAGDTPEKSDCAGDSCQSVETGSYKPSDHQRVAPAPICLAVAHSLPLYGEKLQEKVACFVASTSPPPELPRAWQF